VRSSTLGKETPFIVACRPPQATTLAPTSPHFPYPPIFPPTLTLTYQPLHSQAFTHFVNSFVFNNYNMLVQIVVVLCCWVSYVLQGVGNILVWFFTTWFDSCLPSVRPNSWVIVQNAKDHSFHLSSFRLLNPILSSHFWVAGDPFWDRIWHQRWL
jgi:hypothetical protein